MAQGDMRLRRLAWLLSVVTAACSSAGGSDLDGVIPTADTGSTTVEETGDETSPEDSSVTPPEDSRPPEDTGTPPEAGDGGFIPGCGLDSDGDGITDAIEGKGAAGGDVDTD